MQELCLGGTLAGFMQSGGLTTPLGGVHIQRILSLLLDVAHGIMHLHACGHTGGDIDPSHVWLQLQDSEEAGHGTILNSIDESTIDTGAHPVWCLLVLLSEDDEPLRYCGHRSHSLF